jgi:integrase
VLLGKDPVGEKLEARTKVDETLGALLPKYLAYKRQHVRVRTFEEIERHLSVHARQLHARAVAAIDRRAVALWLTDVAEKKGPAIANRVRASLSACFGWMIREGLIEANPVLNTNKAAEAGARERVLVDDELREIWQALGDDQYSSVVRLLMLTGARRNEIGNLRWSEVDLDKKTIALPAERTKNGWPHLIPLTAAALACLRAQPRRQQADGSQRDLVFGHGERGWQDWSGSKADLDARILEARKKKQPKAKPIEDWTLHDFRRSLSTAMHERLNIMPHVVEAVLGHVGHRAGVPGTYNLSSYDEQKAIALARWADHVETLVTGKRPSSTVVKMRGRGA